MIVDEQHSNGIGEDGVRKEETRVHLSKEQILQLLSTLETMRREGFDVKDTRYQTLVRILKSQDLRPYIKRTDTSLPKTEKMEEDNREKQLSPSNHIEQIVEAESKPPAQPLVQQQRKESPFTQDQLNQLKAQIYVYKRLIRNEPISPALLLAIRGQNPNSISLNQLAATPSPNMSINSPYTPSSQYNSPSTPSSNWAQPPLRQPEKTRGIKSSIPTIIPGKVDTSYLLQEREKVIKAKLNAKLKELSALPSDFPPKLKLNAEIEMAQIRLLDYQKQIRSEILTEIKRLVSSETTSDRQLYRKRKVVSKLTGPEKNKQDQEVRRHKKHRDFLAAITSHHRNFKEYYNLNIQRVKKVNRAISAYHVSKARKEQQMKEKAEKERLRALKENDEVAYMKLLEQTKNNRLSQLLAQTDDYLNQIGARLQEAKTSNEDPNDKSNNKEFEKKSLTDMTEDEKKRFIEKEKEDAKTLQSTKTYYTIAHTIQEAVTDQPEMLIGGKLKRYQLDGLQWLVSLFNNNLNGVLADEMGLGKTIQTIALLSHLIEKKGCTGPFLIIVPLSTLPNWEMELSVWAPSIVNVIFQGTPASRKNIYYTQLATGKFNSLLTTYEFIIRDKNLLSKIHWNYIIIDEGHRMKNSQCKLTTILSKNYKSKHRLLLTGTPLQNSLPELWSLLNFLLPTIFNSVDNFEQWFSAPFSAAGDKSDMTEEETLLIIYRLHKVLRPFLLRRLKVEVEDQLPEKVEKVLRCDSSAMQRALYRSIQDNGILLVDPKKNKQSAKGIMNTLMQLRKVCNHPYLFNLDFDFAIDNDLIRSSGKFVLLDHILPKLIKHGHRLLIFSQMTSLMTIMEYYLEYRGYNYLRLDGSTKAEDRSNLLKLFNEKDSPYHIFILSTRAGGLGLNLQTADTVIIFDSDWNPQMDLQAQDRAHRIGQKKEVRVFRLVTINSIEEDILERANYKLDVDKKIIQAGMFNNSSSQSERRDFLKKLLQKSEEVEEEVLPNAAQINKMIARSEEELVNFNQYDLEQDEIREREWKLNGMKGPKPLPIMQDHELPDWMTKGTVEDILEKQIEYGRGMRDHGNITYNDTLDESEWLDFSSEDDTPAQKTKKRKRSSSRNNLDQLSDSSEDDLEIEEEEEEEAAESDSENSDFGSPVNKGRRGGASSTDPKKRSNPRLTSNSTPKLITTPKPSPLSNPRKKQKIEEVVDDTPTFTSPKVILQKKLNKILEEVRASADDTGRTRSFLFEKLPAKRDYPDYYQIIKKPIDLFTIKKRIDQKVPYYNDLFTFKEEMDLLFSNAREYNIEGSEVYNDSVIMQELCHSLVNKYSGDDNNEEFMELDQPSTGKKTNKRGTKKGDDIEITEVKSSNSTPRKRSTVRKK